MSYTTGNSNLILLHSLNILSRFRWVVCQIDILKRLKRNRDTITKALESLPRTLDETYERIFLQIPDEAQLFVHHALKWIYAHNALRNNNICTSNLIQAIKRSTAGLDSSGYDYDYNEALLREFYGCLILLVVSPPKRGPHGKCGKPTTAVSFAHYTVLEFLDSARIQTGPASCFAISNEIVKLEFAQMVMLEALDTKENELCNIERLQLEGHYERITHAMEEDFNMYSIASSILATRAWGPALSADAAVCKLAFAMFNFANQHFAAFENIAACIECATGIFVDCRFPFEQFWCLHWNQQPTNNDVRTLLNLLYTDISGELGRKYIQSTHEENWLRSTVDIRLETWDVTGNAPNFKGTVVELFALLTGPYHLNLLLELAVGYFDPTNILLTSVGWHGHERIFDRHGHQQRLCSLARLLQLGADPNGHGYRICPLQIAVGAWDLNGVRVLLEAGADPNHAGHREGKRWKEGTVLAHFNVIMDCSPLNIVQTMDCVFRGSSAALRKNARPRIVELLHQYGARNFTTSDSESSMSTTGSTASVE